MLDQKIITEVNKQEEHMSNFWNQKEWEKVYQIWELYFIIKQKMKRKTRKLWYRINKLEINVCTHDTSKSKMVRGRGGGVRERSGGYMEGWWIERMIWGRGERGIEKERGILCPVASSTEWNNADGSF